MPSPDLSQRAEATEESFVRPRLMGVSLPKVSANLKVNWTNYKYESQPGVASNRLQETASILEKMKANWLVDQLDSEGSCSVAW